jgi:hypothetical protein
MSKAHFFLFKIYIYLKYFQMQNEKGDSLVELRKDEKILFKYLSENITDSTKKSLLNALDEVRKETRAEGWIKIDNRTIPELNTEVLVVIDYSAFGRGRTIKPAKLLNTTEPIEYGGINALIGSGILTGEFWSLPSILPFELVTHYRLKPELPNE